MTRTIWFLCMILGAAAAQAADLDGPTLRLRGGQVNSGGLSLIQAGEGSSFDGSIGTSIGGIGGGTSVGSSVGVTAPGYWRLAGHFAGSETPLPEPSALLSLAAGGTFLSWLRGRRRVASRRTRGAALRESSDPGAA